MEILKENEEKFMKIAFELAREALTANEVPVGCVFVSQVEFL